MLKPVVFIGFRQFHPWFSPHILSHSNMNALKRHIFSVFRAIPVSWFCFVYFLYES